MNTDKEKGQTGYSYISGFGSFADFISHDGDHSTAVYRRFDRLAARDLLYYQSELMRLEALQDEYDIQDAKDVLGSDSDRGLEIRSYARDWDRLKLASEIPPSSGVGAPSGTVEERWAARMKLAKEIRETLRAYREALIQESTLLALRQPSHQTMKALSGYFHNRARDSGAFPMLRGTSAQLYPWDMTESQITS